MFVSNDVLRNGNRSIDVFFLQKALCNAGYYLNADSDFGHFTETTVMAFQRDKGLVKDGVVGPLTREALAKASSKRFLSFSEAKAAAEKIGISLPALFSILKVESAGNGLLKDGRPLVLFERHVFLKELTKRNIATEDLLKSKPDLVNSKPGGYLGGAKEHDRLSQAVDINADAAYCSTSWGLFQVMGFHWQSLNFASVKAFVEHMSKNESNQLDCFVRFIGNNPAIKQAIIKEDWATVARLYNGPNYAINRYDERLHNAFVLYTTYLKWK